MIHATRNQPCLGCDARDERLLLPIGSAQAWQEGARIGIADLHGRSCTYGVPGFVWLTPITPGYYCAACWEKAVRRYDYYDQDTGLGCPLPAVEYDARGRQKRGTAWALL